MSKILKVLLTFTISFSTTSFGQDLVKDLQNSCVQNQVKDHKGIKNLTVRAKDFNEYCGCESEFIMNNSSETQLSELKSRKVPPQWFGDLQSKAMKSCLATDSKINS